jgi:general secretion pathway protein A
MLVLLLIQEHDVIHNVSAMYKEYFGLKEPPFSIAPDPHYLYMSDHHREALAHLLYGINSDNGFVLLTGDVGTGKTTVCRCLLQQLPENSNIAFILNPKVTVDELLATICDELGIVYPEGNVSNKRFIDSINSYLLAANAKGRRTVLIIEEAQNLTPAVLEQIRLLTNLETNERKLLQIIMLGQPELNDILSRPELRQLKQRITARYHLGPLTKRELGAYVLHRLSVAGVDRKLFPASTIDRLFRLSGGIPRMINLLCDRALLGTYVQGKGMVDVPTLLKAAREVFGGPVKREKRKLGWLFVFLLPIVCMVAAGAGYYSHRAKTIAAASPVSSAASMVQPGVSRLTSIPQAVTAWPSEKGKEQAFQALFSKWGISEQSLAGIAPCQRAISFGLRCLQASDKLSSLIKLNRPAVLKLSDEKGGEFYVALTAVQGEKATVESGKEAGIVDVKEIERKWLGDYTLLWKLPPGYRDEIQPGSKGIQVAWVDLQLAAIRGREPSRQKVLIYSWDLVSEVKNFQISEGLIPDGIIGPQTIIHLSTGAGSNSPKLVRRQGET